MQTNIENIETNTEATIVQDLDKSLQTIDAMEVKLSILNKIIEARQIQVNAYHKNWEQQIQNIIKRLDKAAKLINNAEAATERLLNQILVYK